jgi:hypothetical protein
MRVTLHVGVWSPARNTTAGSTFPRGLRRLLSPPGLVVVLEVEGDFAVVIDEPGPPSLKKERSNPRVLPVDDARNVAILGEDIVWSDVPVPDCGPAEGGSLWREI